PLWCRLPNDTVDYVYEPGDIPPAEILLDDAARCCCGNSPAQGEISTYSRVFTVYGLRKAHECRIEVSDCPSCHHRFRQVGPDCGSIGVFNWNNVVGFTHELLNQYTNVFTTSPTPFASFVVATRRLYTAARSPVPFCTPKMFTSAWFAFTSLQPLDSGMECPTCGKHPEIVIADGVSIGYSSAKFVQGLRPPTLIQKTSPKNSMVRN
ncbi:hypothetical protein GLOTRDRAFT_13631, partial [Gloeophyllum trabeum ATCC 11539]